MVFSLQLIGHGLLEQFEKAIKMHARHETMFVTFTNRFDPKVIEKWDSMINDWDADSSKPNPYEDLIICKHNATDGVYSQQFPLRFING